MLASNADNMLSDTICVEFSAKKPCLGGNVAFAFSFITLKCVFVAIEIPTSP